MLFESINFLIQVLPVKPTHLDNLLERQLTLVCVIIEGVLSDYLSTGETLASDNRDVN